MKFEIFQSQKNHKYYFRLKSRNGQVVMASEGYNDKSGALNGAKAVQRAAETKGNFKENIAKDGRHYFNLHAANHQIVGTSQMYQTRSGCRKCVKSIMSGAPDAALHEV